MDVAHLAIATSHVDSFLASLCASAVANPARSDVFLRIPRRRIRSKKEIKCFVQGVGVIRSERWLAECAVARRKSGLFTVRFSGKYLPLDATTILSLMQSSLTRHTIGPRIVSSEEDYYPLDAPSLPDFTKPAPRPLFDDGSDQGSDRGGTLSSINPTQCIGECSITPSDFEGSADEDNDLELLVERIKSWSLSRDVFGELLDDMNFPELQDCAEIKNLTEAQWQDLLSFIQENTSILRFFKKRRSWTLEAEQRRTNSKNSYNVMNT
ncbi:hypothetical protein C8Q72DRAFT_794447 [Fomitopsis betulina]|nr:hypothetical protein C8Q72DRAFT_794447 [Fomitopsis betulina]